MSDLLPDNVVRALVAPCGHIAALDCTPSVPGFCRTLPEAEDDNRLGFHEKRRNLADVKAEWTECDHEPKWGVSSE